MKVRWLGNAAIEIFGEQHLLIDPNWVTPPKHEADIVLLTHEHDDHFSKKDYKAFGAEAELYAPQTALEKFEVEGTPVAPGDEIGDIKVLESDCWGSEESVSFFFHGVLHTGDSASYPTIEEVQVIFSACFPDYYEDYIAESKRLNPQLVIPFHYDPEEGQKDAEGLKKKLEQEGIESMVLKAGQSIEV